MKTQQDKVLKHLKTRDKLTSVEAIGLYGITRLADVVFKLKGRGHNIKSIRRKGVLGHYAEYRLEKQQQAAA